MKRVLMTVLVGLLSSAVLCVSAFAQTEKPENSAAQDLLIKSEVETAVSMLQAIYAKHQQGAMTLEKAKELGADLLRELQVRDRRIFLGRYDGRRQCGSLRPKGCGGTESA